MPAALRTMAAVVAGAIALIGSDAAAAQTMGTPLGAGQFVGAPDNPYDCTRYDTRLYGLLPVPAPGGAGLATSCIWIDTPTTDLPAAFAPNAYGPSTVTQVRVAVGATTGPMEAVVIRSLYQNTATPGKPSYACCVFIAASPPFTPQAATVTAVNVDLPMREDPTPAEGDLTTIAVSDILGLAILEPGVPVPMYDIGDSQTINLLWNTATPSSQIPAFSGDTVGFHVAMQADYTPGSAALAGRLARIPQRSGSLAVSGAESLLGGTPAAPSSSGACRARSLCIAPYMLF